MSRDNWERLVESVLRNEELREIARAPSTDPSDVSSSLSFRSVSSYLNSRLNFSSPPHEHVPVSHRQALNKSRAVPFARSSFVHWIIPKEWLAKQKEKFFQQKEKLSWDDLANEKFRIFSSKDLLRATNKFNEGNIIYKGNYRTVYKGILPDNRVVAIKMYRIIHQIQIDQFINEVTIASQINHRNVAKLLGCCLETKVPLLVYEFIPNGTLFSHIHDPTLASRFSWEMRVKVAAGAARALAYLHSATSTPFVHKDIKSTNILLDHTYTTKLIHFDISRLFSNGQFEVTTLMQGLIGYLDPEYFFTSKLTEKSDVYSFGVVLAELLTGQKAISYDRSKEQRSLVMYFVSAIRDDRLIQILDVNLVRGDLIERLKQVAELTERCLRVKSEERPSMEEVAMELETLRSVENHQWRDEDLNEEEMKENLFNPTTLSNINDGFLLRHKNFGDYLANEKIRILTVEDLQRATKNFDEGNIIGRGKYGTIYKGISLDYGVVAIKKPILVTQGQIEKYINEVKIASQINHQNVVKTLGCCLGTEVPLLVYEFTTNGTLFNHIHDPVLSSNFSWEMRIKIAAETAEALAYLHMIPFIHGDIKSANILLDQTYTAKVSDFGAYRFDTLDDSALTTLVQGTVGYLDPDHLHFGQLIEKSDVYSFGVVLAELLTSQKAFSRDRPGEDRILPSYFLNAIRDDRLVQILDKNLIREDRIEQLKRVAKLSESCLRSQRKERPNMKEVAMELEALRSVENYQWRDEYLNQQEIIEQFLSSKGYMEDLN